MGPRRGRGRRGRAGEDDGGAVTEDDDSIAGGAPLSSTNGSTAAAHSRQLEWSLSYLDPDNPIGVPHSRHEGRLDGVGTLGKKTTNPE